MAPKEGLKPVTKRMTISSEMRSTRLRTNTVPKPLPPTPKVQKSIQINGNAPQSTRKAICKRRPLPAHSGVPIPDKMREAVKRGFEAIISSNVATTTRERTQSLPKSIAAKSTPCVPKENITVSGKKAITKRQPLSPHTGVPIPEKMRETVRRGFEVLNSCKEVTSARERTQSFPKPVATKTIQQKLKENIPQSSKKTIRKPLAAHSGVPITDKMRQALKKGFVLN